MDTLVAAEPTSLSPRARAIVSAARQILEREGPDSLTMRRLGDAVGIRAPSLYKHFPDKLAVEVALINDGFDEIARSFEAALANGEDSLVELAKAYRAFVRSHPHLYRLMTARPLPRERLRSGVEARAAAPIVQAVGDPDRARAVWAFAHGMVSIELDGRFPPDANLDAAWAAGLTAFGAASTPKPGHPPSPGSRTGS